MAAVLLRRGPDCKCCLSGRFYSGGKRICHGYLRYYYHGGLEAFCYFCSGFLGSFSHVFVDHVKNNTEKGLILSPDRPDLSSGVRRYGFPDEENAYQTKDYTPLLGRVKNDTWWHFKLVANPTKSVVSTQGERGHVKAYCSLKYQEEWLLNRAQKHGFELLPENFQIIQRNWHIFRKGKEQGKNRVSIKGVTYEGILKVCDEDKFKKLLVTGIGRGKAYGMGLLTIVHV